MLFKGGSTSKVIFEVTV